MKMNNVWGNLSGVSAKTATLLTCIECTVVMLFSKLLKLFLGHFDPENISLDNEYNYFSG